MSWMVTELEQLKGTQYFEFLPGAYAHKCWNEGSAFIHEKHFYLFEKIIEKHCNQEIHYRFLNIERGNWEAIISDYQVLQNKLIEGARVAQLEADFGRNQRYKERFLQSECENLEILCATLDDLIKWLQDSLIQSDVIAILGI